MEYSQFFKDLQSGCSFNWTPIQQISSEIDASPMEMADQLRISSTEPLWNHASPDPFDPMTTVEHRTMMADRAVIRVHDVLG